MQDSEDPLKVITNSAVGHPIVVHDLDATELVIGGIYFPPEDLEKRARDIDLDRNKGQVYFVILTKKGSFLPKTEIPASVVCLKGLSGPLS